MGADFIFRIVPMCEHTEARAQEAKEAAARDMADFAEGELEGLCEALEYYWTSRDSREIGEYVDYQLPFDLLVTGGMSAGAAPTEALGEFAKIQYSSEVYALLVKWSQEDRKAHAAKEGA